MSNIKVIGEGKSYQIPNYKIGKGLEKIEGVFTDLRWVKGDRTLDNPCVQEGIISEDVLACVATHLEFINVGHLANDYTKEAIEYIKKAKKCLEDRKVDREIRNVFATNKS